MLETSAELKVHDRAKTVAISERDKSILRQSTLRQATTLSNRYHTSPSTEKTLVLADDLYQFILKIAHQVRSGDAAILIPLQSSLDRAIEKVLNKKKKSLKNDLQEVKKDAVTYFKYVLGS